MLVIGVILNFITVRDKYFFHHFHLTSRSMTRKTSVKRPDCQTAARDKKTVDKVEKAKL